MFDHEGPAVVNAMHDITIGVFEHPDITSPMDVDQRLAYMQRILIGAALKKYKVVLVECKKLEHDLVGDSWDLGNLKELSTDNFWTWANKYGIGYDGDT